ncbi:MAG: hypothetical protein EKK48_10235 [Candidatus Melainabacteria bacterium]|nr:MAG: hypothetical protein EKK48_10235 [Candidatus Melainabacteria bacterium]
MNWSQNFVDDQLVPAGVSQVAVTAVDGSNNSKTNGYAESVNNGLSSTLTYDLNGNMTSDGTNRYSWDAENRLIKITYPGSGNNSQFTFDGNGICAKIVEVSGGSTTSTKQFVWCGGARCEERDGAGSTTKKFFSNGQTISGSKYFYTKDQLGSIREMTDTSGVIQAQYAFDPFGRVTQIASAQSSDLRYAGYYGHSPSGLNLTTYRAYNAALGRWISRDPIGETGDNNLFAYAYNLPTSVIDPSGLQGNVISAPPSGMGTYIMDSFEGMTGAPSGVFGPGCISVVDFYLGLGPGVVPESVYKKNCFWGKGSDPTPAIKKAKCTPPCPKGTHKVIWCKQGTWGTLGINPNPPGSPVASPGSGWNNAGSSNFNYAVYFPSTSTFIGANVGGGAGYASTSMQFGSEFGSSMCCASCVKNKLRLVDEG